MKTNLSNLRAPMPDGKFVRFCVSCCHASLFMCLCSHSEAQQPPKEFDVALRQAYFSESLEWLPEQNRLLLKGKVNGQDARFKIDSGAIGSLLTLKSAKKMGLKIFDFGTSFTGVSGRGKVYGSPVGRLELGDHIDLQRQRMAVLDLSVLDSVDGLIGGDTLASTKAILDYGNHQLLVPRPDVSLDVAKIASDAGLTVTRLEREGNFLVL